MKTRSDRWVQRGGFACGLAVVAAVLAGARVPAEPQSLGLDLSVVPAPPSTLTVKPLKPLITASGMRAGERSGEASGHLTVINPASTSQRVRLRALPSSRTLDAALVVSVSLDGTEVYSGPLGGLRSATRRSVLLQSGDGAELRMRVRLPAGATGWRGRIEDVNLAFDAAPVAPR